jgi:predicted ribosome quality control (RQC) complex YloA/Tae2 family protein
MSFDGLFTHAVVNELKENLVGGRVAKIHQPFSNELILRIRAHRKNQQLLLSAHPQYARIQLTDLQFENPQQPPQFCMVLRKYIEGSVLVDIQQLGNDRVVEFIFTGRDELGDEQNYHLITEIMGRHSNILLVNKSENKIYEAIRHIPPSQNSYRTLLPGADYRPAPAQDSRNPFNYTGEVVIEGDNMKERVKSVQSQFQGFGRDSAKELLFQMDQQTDKTEKEIFDAFLQPYKEHQYEPVLTDNLDNNKTYFTALPYFSIPGDKESFESFKDLLDEYYEDKAERDRVRQQTNDLMQVLKNEREKNENKLVKLEKEDKQANAAEKYRAEGEILTAYMHLVEQGMEEVTLENFYDNNEPITITLDPQKSPAENAQWYFSQYQKLKSRKKHLATQIPLTRQEINYIDSVMAQVEIASSNDIEEIREELRDQGYLKKQRKKQKKSQKSGPEKYYSSDGILIYVGKNNRQNDQLTMRTANKTDYWLHTKDIPGSHVVIRNDNPSEKTIEEAAILAAYHSKYRMSSSVPVDYTQIKHVRKPNGAKPGYVIYDNQKTVFVTPDKKTVRQLKNNKEQ